MADTLYLLIITNRKDKVKEKKKKRKGKTQGNKRRRNREKTYSCTFTPWSYTTWGIQPLSKQKVVGLLLIGIKRFDLRQR